MAGDGSERAGPVQPVLGIGQHVEDVLLGDALGQPRLQLMDRG